jgi:hypothetical protein
VAVLARSLAPWPLASAACTSGRASRLPLDAGGESAITLPSAAIKVTRALSCWCNVSTSVARSGAVVDPAFSVVAIVATRRA